MNDKGKYLSLFQANSRSLGETLKAAEASLGVKLTIHDPRGLFYGVGISREWFRHNHKLCDYKRTGAADKRCFKTCMYEVGTRAKSNPTPEIKECWKDLSEIVVPIYRNNDFQFILFVGLFRTKEASQFFTAGMAEQYCALETCDVEKAENLSRLVNHLGQSILLYLENYYFASSNKDDRKPIIQRFIYHRATKKISLDDLASHLFLSTSRTSHLVSDLFGKSFSELVKDERIKRACSILKNSRKPINQIPALIGIDNEYYFYRLFKKEVGMTPKKYRDQHPSEQSLA